MVRLKIELTRAVATKVQAPAPRLVTVKVVLVTDVHCTTLAFALPAAEVVGVALRVFVPRQSYTPANADKSDAANTSIVTNCFMLLMLSAFEFPTVDLSIGCQETRRLCHFGGCGIIVTARVAVDIFLG